MTVCIRYLLKISLLQIRVTTSFLSSWIISSTHRVIPWKSVTYKDYKNVVNGQDDDETTVKVTKDAGRLVYGQTGVYSIQEKKAPDGYIITNSNTVYFEVSLSGFETSDGDKSYIRLVNEDGTALDRTSDEYKEIIL